MAETNEAIKLHRGLRGVYFDRSPLHLYRWQGQRLRYRGYSIHDLAQHATFEETAWLLLHGELPTRSELLAFDQELRAARQLPGAVLDIISAIIQGSSWLRRRAPAEAGGRQRARRLLLLHSGRKDRLE